jgi:hypothetical protein
MAGKQVVRCRDFTAGQVDEDALRRDDNELQRSSARVFRNARPLGVGAGKQRPGRRVISNRNGRMEPFRLGTSSYRIHFGSASVAILDTDQTQLVEHLSMPWTLDTVNEVRYAVVGADIIICYPNWQPRIIKGTDWTMETFAFQETLRGTQLAPFYRYARPGVQMKVSDTNGTIDIEFDQDVLEAGHVGAVFRYAGRQVIVTAVTDAQNGTADALEELPPTYEINVSGVQTYQIGEVVEGDQSGAKGLIVDIASGKLYVVTTTNFGGGFTVDESLVGPNGKKDIVSTTKVTPYFTPEWDEIIMSEARGWPRGVSMGFGRMHFFDFPEAPDAWVASRIGAPDDMHIGAEASDAFLETVPGKATVTDVVSGADVFIFTDRSIFYVPVTENNPLKPGSVTFRQIGRDGAARIRPIETADGVVYVNVGLSRIMALVGTGQTARPYVLQDLTQYHADLISTPRCLAATTGDGTLPERYVYVVNSDGTMAVGRIDIERRIVGWQPWTGEQNTRWVAAEGTELLVCGGYGGVRPTIEVLDDTVYLDCWFEYNGAANNDLDPPVGKGPLYFLRDLTVTLMDGLRDLGDREVDADGFLVKATPEDDFTSATLVAGFCWTLEIAPFVQHVQGGQSGKQALRKRRILQAAVTVRNSTGFTFGNRQIGPYRWGEDTLDDPPLRSETQKFRPRGWDFDPEISLVKDRPGPLTLLEITLEVTV